MTFEVTSKTRDDIRAVAADNGWTLTPSAYGDDFERTVTLDPQSNLGIFVAAMDWDAREKVSVSYSSAGSAIYGHTMGPRDQAALDGRFVDMTDLGAPRKAKVIAALKAAPAV